MAVPLRTFLVTFVRDMRSQPLRTFLTLSGVVWGTLSITLLLAFGVGVQKRQIRDFRGLGENIIIVWPTHTSLPYRGLSKGRPIRITPEDVEWLRTQVPAIARISPEFRDDRHVRYGDRRMTAQVAGVNVEYADMRNVISGQGRFLNRLDIEGWRRVCFLGNKIAETLFGTDDPIGRTVFIERFPFQVVGVLKPKTQNSTYGARDESCIYIPYTTYRVLFGVRYVDSFVMQPRDPARSETLVRRMREVLGPRLGFDPNDEEALFTWDTTHLERFLRIFFLTFNGFLGLIGSLTLSVAGMGVAAIMHVVVEERIREIGVKMALGMRRRTVLLQFLGETAWISARGAVWGVLFAWNLVNLVRLIPIPEETWSVQAYLARPVFSVPIAVAYLIIMAGIVLFSGVFPALRAARLQPVEALRTE